jgi:hypothetical protein
MSSFCKYYGIDKDSNLIPDEVRVLLLVNTFVLSLRANVFLIILHWERLSVCVLPLRLKNFASYQYKTFWEQLIAYFPLIRHRPHRRWRVKQFFSLCMCIRCCSNVFTVPLPSNTHTNTEWWEEFMKYAFEMASGAIIYIPSFIKIGSSIGKLMEGGGVTAWPCRSSSG